ncbi:general secretion pathway protein GspD [Vibrio sp. qd031]|uniref:type II and III secretion system protein family protein n=1 Tax=Vibrio sp. qd031 TaxID=1603038 RepID=UPI000A0F708C|nr:pilus assembly protein N-terminal domain-containing protein [Vibrio sp. qd031]ORT49217.1 general secretion pathway protein GspD [Vibrio sp. qd031]
MELKTYKDCCAKFCLSLLAFLFVSATHAASLINIGVGDAHYVSTKRDIGSVFISDPSIADYHIIQKDKIIFYGKKVGTTTLLVFDDEGGTILSNKLVVNKSLVHIQQQLQIQYPDSEVSVSNLGDQVVLTGTVATEQIKDEIHLMVGELLGKEGVFISNGLIRTYRFPGVVNNVKVVTTKQVNVRLTVAEVSHTFMEDFGVQIGTTSPGVFVDQLINFSADDISTIITAVNNDNVAQVLAEPNMSVISGQSASFLAGGEIPVVTVSDGGTNVIYKEYGVRLQLQAQVLQDDKIVLSLAPEVSSIDNQYQDGTYDLPSLTSRKVDTTIELGDGQSFVLGGLLNSQDKESLQKIPYIGDIPILGAMFRNTSTERIKTELIIVATVNLVEPVEANTIQLPTMKKTNNLARFFAIEQEYPTAIRRWSEQVLSKGGFKR